MDKNYQPNWFTLALSTITLGIYLGMPHILLALFVLSFVYRWAAVTLAIALATLLLPPGPVLARSIQNSYLFLTWRRYFHFSFLFEENLCAHKDYVIAQFPHGSYPLGQMLGGTFMATEYPEYNVYCLAAPAALMIPLWRHVHAWLGAWPATKRNFHRLLNQGVNGLRGANAAAANAAAAVSLKEEAARDAERVARGEHLPSISVVSVGGKPTICQGCSLAGSEGGACGDGAIRAVRGGGGGGGGGGFRIRRHSSSSSSSGSSSGGSGGGSGSGSDCSPDDSPRSMLTMHRGGARPPKSALGAAPLLTHQRWLRPPATAPAADGACSVCSRKLGLSVGVMIGGIAEMFMQFPEREQVKLHGRKGFVRVAVEHGSDILPVYIFGNSQALSFGPTWLMRLSRRVRASIGMLRGRWGLPVPRRVPLLMAVGAPVRVGNGLAPDHPDFEARVDEVHAAVIAAVTKVYYTHREEYGWGDRPLTVV